MAEKESAKGFDKDEIVKLLQKAKSQGNSYPFAFGLASKPEECALTVHIRKPGKTLKTEMKQSGAKVKKVCFGTLSVQGAEVLLNPVKPLKGIVRQLKKRFRDAGMVKFKPVLVGPDGEEIDEEGLPDADQYDDSDDDAPEVQVVPAQDPAPQPENPGAALKARLVALQPQVKAIGGDAAVKLGGAMKTALSQIQEEKFEAADKSITMIETAASKVEVDQPAAASPALSKMQEAIAKIAARIKALPDGDQKRTLGGEAKTALGLIQNGEVEKAVSAMKGLQAGLLAAEKGDASATPAGDPLETWRTAKEKVDVSISALQKALKGFSHPDLDRIAEFGLNGVSDGNQTAMNRALFEFNGAQGPDREKAGAKLVTEVAQYRQFLASNKIIDLCEQNPFGVAVDIKGPLKTALDDIEKAVA